MDAGEDTQSKCQNNNLVHLPALFFYCSDRKKKPLEHALKVCVVIWVTGEGEKLGVLTWFSDCTGTDGKMSWLGATTGEVKGEAEALRRKESVEPLMSPR